MIGAWDAGRQETVEWESRSLVVVADLELRTVQRLREGCSLRFDTLIMAGARCLAGGGVMDSSDMMTMEIKL